MVRRARLVLVVAMLAVLGWGRVRRVRQAEDRRLPGPGRRVDNRADADDQRFGGSVGVVLLVHAEAGTVDDAPVRAAGAEAASRLAAVPGVSNVVSYWQTRNPGLRSKDGKYALILGSTKSDRDLSSSELAALRSHSRQVDVTVGGSAAIGNDILKQVGKSLRSAEVIAVPIILALLVFAFGNVVAALLPLAIGVIAILGTFAELFVLGSVTNVAIYAINLTTALGLALVPGVDHELVEPHAARTAPVPSPSGVSTGLPRKPGSLNAALSRASESWNEATWSTVRSGGGAPMARLTKNRLPVSMWLISWRTVHSAHGVGWPSWSGRMADTVAPVRRRLAGTGRSGHRTSPLIVMDGFGLGHLLPVPGRCALTGRISYQMRAWFNGPWHLGLRAWSAAVFVFKPQPG